MQYHVCSRAQTWEKTDTFLLSDYKAVFARIQVGGEFFLRTSGALCSLQVKKNRSITEL